VERYRLKFCQAAQLHTLLAKRVLLLKRILLASGSVLSFEYFAGKASILSTYVKVL